MDNLVIHTRSELLLRNLLAHTPQAILITGSRGIGKTSIAQRLAADLLHLTTTKLGQYAYFQQVVPEKPESMGIGQMRELEHFLRLKVPGNQQAVRRVALLEDAHLLTVEAQNALLKTLEEPPEQTVIILTAAYEQSLLPTIRSRVQTVPLLRPPLADVMAHFSQDYDNAQVERVARIAGRLPGLMHTLLASDTQHPLYLATEQARQLLQATRFERLIAVDGLSKERQKSLDLLQILQQMSELALPGSNVTTAQRWKSILEAAYTAEGQLRSNAQPKLVLTNFMLAM